LITSLLFISETSIKISFYIDGTLTLSIWINPLFKPSSVPAPAISQTISTFHCLETENKKTAIIFY